MYLNIIRKWPLFCCLPKFHFVCIHVLYVCMLLLLGQYVNFLNKLKNNNLSAYNCFIKNVFFL